MFVRFTFRLVNDLKCQEATSCCNIACHIWHLINAALNLVLLLVKMMMAVMIISMMEREDSKDRQVVAGLNSEIESLDRNIIGAIWLPAHLYASEQAIRYKQAVCRWIDLLPVFL